jgi:hypothetical protein
VAETHEVGSPIGGPEDRQLPSRFQETPLMAWGKRQRFQGNSDQSIGLQGHLFIQEDRSSIVDARQSYPHGLYRSISFGVEPDASS